jgi:hypothetical protein
MASVSKLISSSAICNRCNLDCKYISLLKRHQNLKKKCEILNPTYIEPTEEQNQYRVDDDTKDKVLNILNTSDNINDKANLISAIINDTSTDIIEKSRVINFVCNNCDRQFSRSDNLKRHQSMNRCKVKKQQNKITNESINANSNINGSNNNTTNSNVNSNNTTNNTTNNNTTNNIYNVNFNINAFGCESIENINKKEIMFIYQNSRYIAYNLCNFIYIKNKDNMSFYKYNINSKSFTVLTPEMETENIPDFIFRDNLNRNIVEISLELFHKNKDNLSEAELCKCMENLMRYQNAIVGNQEAIDQHKEIIDSIIETVLRTNKVKEKIETFENTLNNNQQLKKDKITNTKDKLKYRDKCVKEYYSKPEENNQDTKHLNKIKMKASRNILPNNNLQNNQ